LAADEPAAVQCLRPGGTSPVILACEHAGNLIPRRLGDLGLSSADLGRHIALDIGAADVAVAVSDALDAPLVLQRYSRLICDCNRAPGHPEFILEESDGTAVPGNLGLDDAARQARLGEIYGPFHKRLAALVAARRGGVLVSIHSFTPVLAGRRRPWAAGVLFNRPGPFARAVLDDLAATTDEPVGENEPYSLISTPGHTLSLHADANGWPAIEIEVRQDLLGAEDGRRAWAGRIARAIRAGLEATGSLKAASTPDRRQDTRADGPRNRGKP
jgi:predicted N-formylglutamate amidohydrolase